MGLGFFSNHHLCSSILICKWRVVFVFSERYITVPVSTASVPSDSPFLGPFFTLRMNTCSKIHQQYCFSRTIDDANLTERMKYNRASIERSRLPVTGCRAIHSFIKRGPVHVGCTRSASVRLYKIMHRPFLMDISV